MPTLFLTGWVVLLVRHGHVGRWFFLVSLALALLCFPAGPIVEKITADATCRPQEGLACGMGGATVVGWSNGVLGLCSLVVLLLLTAMVELRRR